jgi:phosphatidate cytidylyltransferase
MRPPLDTPPPRLAERAAAVRLLAFADPAALTGPGQALAGAADRMAAFTAGVGVVELVRALQLAGTRPPLIPLLAGALMMPSLAWTAGVKGMLLGLLVTVAAAALWRLRGEAGGYRRDLTAAVLIVAYVPLLLSFGVLLVEPDDGRLRVLAALLAVVLSDTGGYAVGVRFGKHPMAPTISPKKSWEGFVGSLLTAALGSALALHVALDVAVYKGVIFGVALAVVAVLGDLAESFFKRRLGIKDMSQLLPGHGGLMDRLDSILFALPTAFLLLSLIAPLP